MKGYLPITNDPLIKERERERKRFDRQSRAKARADAYFNIYYEMGADRSLAKLHAYIVAIGGKVSTNTLERYSSSYNWQVEVAKRDSQLAEIRRKEQAESIQAMEQRHAEMARAAQQIIAGGMRHYLDAIKSSQPKELSITEITNSMRNVIAIERTARGEPVERKEYQIQWMNTWVIAVSQIFASINKFPTEQMRIEEFSNRFDQFVEQQLSNFIE